MIQLDFHFVSCFYSTEALGETSRRSLGARKAETMRGSYGSAQAQNLLQNMAVSVADEVNKKIN
jgi:hypothetical protein